MHLKKVGDVFWTNGVNELEVMEHFDWEWVLLDLLNIWYTMPEYWYLPIFINETAEAVLIPYYRAEELAVLFQHPSSVILGWEDVTKWQNELKATVTRSQSKPLEAHESAPFFSSEPRPDGD